MGRAFPTIPEAGGDPFSDERDETGAEVHFDYAGADGFSKPMTWTLAADPSLDKDDYARLAREAFHAQFPEWKLRDCVVADEDSEIEEPAERPGRNAED